ncbi:hypothetical protein F4804DRAFT_41070 [Jackrogersella minutella]|nr:hypothetical protein F4804DRAFT_41070 [Jackrogersella minutella]
MALSRRFLTTLSKPSRIRFDTRRLFSTESIADPSNRVQAYISRSTDPYLNLSIEQHLLTKTAAETVVLFLYANRPCVVIGRNQNPWLEVNLGLLRGDHGVVSGGEDEVQLARRRSGGGTVFHDAGNVNYSVVCPTAAFDRDKHAAMVVRALAALGVGGARVNKRHDIEMDGPEREGEEGGPFKISGSAYKLTRLRALHHGTCLLDSPNLHRVGPLLRSPAAPYIKARGVDSVRSPIRNVGLSDARAFEDAVVAQFRAMYGDVEAEVIDEAEAIRILRHEPDIAAEYFHLKSPEWIYQQTPEFTFATHPTKDDRRLRPPPPEFVPRDFRAFMTVRHGQIVDVLGTPAAQPLLKRYLHEITDWRAKRGVDPPVGIQVGSNEPIGIRWKNSNKTQGAGSWFNSLFGVGGKVEQ